MHRRLDALAPAAIAAALLACSLVAVAPPALAFVSYGWKSAVSGSADDPTKWNPAGVPTSLDDASAALAGTYTITYPAGVPLTHGQAYTNGTVSLQFAGPHTTHAFYVMPVATATTASARLTGGVLNVDYLQSDGSSVPGSFVVTGRATEFHSNSYVGTYGNGDLVGNFATGSLYVQAGANYWCGISSGTSWGMTIGNHTAANGTVSVVGTDLVTLAPSRLRTSDFADIRVGVDGTGTLNVTGGGEVIAGRGIYLGGAAAGTGHLNVGPGGQFRSSHVYVAGNLGIARSLFVVDAGTADVNVASRSTVNVAGWTEVGSTAGDHGGVLRVQAGGVFTGLGPFRVSTLTGAGLDLRGGLTQLRGGLSWPPGRPLVLSSSVGSPTLLVAGGVASTGPSTSAGINQLTIARGGEGTLRVSGSGTVMNLGPGVTTLGDSLGAIGKVFVDSAGAIAGPSYWMVGRRGIGMVQLRGGASVSTDAVALGGEPSGHGEIDVIGPGSSFTAIGSIDVGGAGAAFGQGTLGADSGGTIRVNPRNAVLPSVRIEPTTGRLVLLGGSELQTTGSVNVYGSARLERSAITARSVNVWVGGALAADGRITGALTNVGDVSLWTPDEGFGTLRVSDYYTQSGVLHVKLGSTGAGGPVSDTLVVGGIATLNGRLALEIEPTFQRTGHDTFTVMTYGSPSGTFADVTWNGAPLAGRATLVYGPHALRVIPANGTAGTDDSPGAPRALRFTASPGASALAFDLDLPEAADVRVRLFDVGGRAVAEAAEGARSAGRHRIALVPHEPLPSGVYFARAEIRSATGCVERTARAVRRR